MTVFNSPMANVPFTLTKLDPGETWNESLRFTLGEHIIVNLQLYGAPSAHNFFAAAHFMSPCCKALLAGKYGNTRKVGVCPACKNTLPLLTGLPTIIDCRIPLGSNPRLLAWTTHLFSLLHGQLIALELELFFTEFAKKALIISDEAWLPYESPFARDRVEKAMILMLSNTVDEHLTTDFKPFG